MGLVRLGDGLYTLTLHHSLASYFTAIELFVNCIATVHSQHSAIGLDIDSGDKSAERASHKSETLPYQKSNETGTTNSVTERRHVFFGFVAVVAVAEETGYPHPLSNPIPHYLFSIISPSLV